MQACVKWVKAQLVHALSPTKLGYSKGPALYVQLGLNIPLKFATLSNVDGRNFSPSNYTNFEKQFLFHPSMDFVLHFNRLMFGSKSPKTLMCSGLNNVVLSAWPNDLIATPGSTLGSDRTIGPDRTLNPDTLTLGNHTKVSICQDLN